jgi:hypothetical protein
MMIKVSEGNVNTASEKRVAFVEEEEKTTTA